MAKNTFPIFEITGFNMGPYFYKNITKSNNMDTVGVEG